MHSTTSQTTSQNPSNPNILIENIYILSEESNIHFKQLGGSEEALNNLRTKIQEKVPEPKFSQDVLKILNGISYLNLEALNTIEKNVKSLRKNKKAGLESSNNFNNLNNFNNTSIKTELPVQITKNNENPSILYKKLNKEKLTTIFKCLGFNMVYCPIIAKKIFINLSHLIQIKEEYDPGKSDFILSTVLIKQNTFYDLAKAVIKALTGTKCRIKKYFNLSYLIISKSIPIVILLGGTSGTGKSTVSSLLASRFGISTVLSTDTIRHIMRNFLSKDEVPVLFASTYEAWKYMDIQEPNNISSLNTLNTLNILNMNKNILKGYCEQSRIVGQKLTKVIENILRRQESVIIEGVHLTIDNIKTIMKMHKYTFPFLVYIEKAEKHKERFAVRSRMMTLDARYNKYVEHFEYIRIIQSYLVKKSDRLLLPKVDNTNVDKSIGMIQETILRSFKDIYNNNISNYDESNDMLSNYFNNFSKLSKNLLSSKEAGVLISQKVNKNFLFEKYFNEKDEKDEKYIDDVPYTAVKETNNFSNNFQQNNCINLNTINSSSIKKPENIRNINPMQLKNCTGESNIGNIGNVHNLSSVINISNTGKLIEEMINSTNDINLSRKLCGNVKKECLSDDEVVAYHKNSLNLKCEKDEDANKSILLKTGNHTSSNNRLNYQMENFKGKRDHVGNFIKSPTIKEKRFSLNINIRRRLRQESEDKESNTNRSASLYKLGSIDSESVIERIKVINETEDEFESIEADQEEYSRSNLSCCSISEDEEKNEEDFYKLNIKV